MWDDAKRLDAIALGIALVAAALAAAAGIAWAARQSVFAIREVVIIGAVDRASAAHLEAVVRDELAGTFFTMNLDAARVALARVAWVRKVTLRRQWPHGLEIGIEEHVPLARWNDAALVNAEGELFVADYIDVLPQYTGPDGRAKELAERYREWRVALAGIGLTLEEVRLSTRGGWELRAVGERGRLSIEIGREDPSAKLARFVAAYGRTIGALVRAGTPVEVVDLRYRNGFAARVPGFRERAPKKAA